MEAECQPMFPQHIHILILEYIFKVKLANEEDNRIEKIEIKEDSRKERSVCGNIIVIIHKHFLLSVGGYDYGQHDSIKQESSKRFGEEGSPIQCKGIFFGFADNFEKREPGDDGYYNDNDDWHNVV